MCCSIVFETDQNTFTFKLQNIQKKHMFFIHISSKSFSWSPLIYHRRSPLLPSPYTLFPDLCIVYIEGLEECVGFNTSPLYYITSLLSVSLCELTHWTNRGRIILYMSLALINRWLCKMPINLMGTNVKLVYKKSMCGIYSLFGFQYYQMLLFTLQLQAAVLGSIKIHVT